MKVGYVTCDIRPNGHFTFFHDLLANLPKPSGEHKVALVGPMWNRLLVDNLKSRGIIVEAIFEDFQPNTEEWWRKIASYFEDCDILLSGNIQNLNYVLRKEFFDKPIVSISICEEGYKTASGGLGGNSEDHYHLAAVSKTATNAFPEFVRERVTPLFSGIDTGRVSKTLERRTLRESWFGESGEETKLALFMGSHEHSKGLRKCIEMLEFLPDFWKLLIPQETKILPGIPDKIKDRVLLATSEYSVGKFYTGSDVLVLPTLREGFSMSLLEAWYHKLPVVTTEHNTMLELQTLHPSVDFGRLLPVDCDGRDIALEVVKAVESTSARKMVLENYTAEKMVERWVRYLEDILNNYGEA